MLATRQSANSHRPATCSPEMFLHLDLDIRPFDLILNGSPRLTMDYPCGKFDDCSFSHFVSATWISYHKQSPVSTHGVHTVCSKWQKDKKNMHTEEMLNDLTTYVWEEGDEFLHVEPNTLQSNEVSSVHPLDRVSTNDVPSWNSDDHVSHSALWRKVRTYPPV